MERMVTCTVLLENTSLPDIPETGVSLHAEHGLSFLLETPHGMLIFDTGRSGAFLDNAAFLGKDLSEASHVVLSHGHYDHAGGMERLAGSGFRGTLHLGRGALEGKYSRDPGGELRFIGTSFQADWLEGNGITVSWLDCAGVEPRTRQILPGIHVLGGFARVHPRETIPSRLVHHDDTGDHPDDFHDETCLAVEGAEGLTVLLGCAHPGIMNMLATVEKVFGQRPFRVLGGSHLQESLPADLPGRVADLKSLGIPRLHLGHCTGAAALALLDDGTSATRPLSGGQTFLI